MPASLSPCFDWQNIQGRNSTYMDEWVDFQRRGPPIFLRSRASATGAAGAVQTDSGLLEEDGRAGSCYPMARFRGGHGDGIVSSSLAARTPQQLREVAQSCGRSRGTSVEERGLIKLCRS